MENIYNNQIFKKQNNIILDNQYINYLSEVKFHDASFDAFATGCVFLKCKENFGNDI